jgi:hypothetical protein
VILEYQRLEHVAVDILSAGMQVRGDLLLAAAASGRRSTGAGTSNRAAAGESSYR